MMSSVFNFLNALGTLHTERGNYHTHENHENCFLFYHDFYLCAPGGQTDQPWAWSTLGFDNLISQRHSSWNMKNPSWTKKIGWRTLKYFFRTACSVAQTLPSRPPHCTDKYLIQYDVNRTRSRAQTFAQFQSCIFAHYAYKDTSPTEIECDKKRDHSLH